MLVYLKNVVTLQLDSEKCTGCRRCLQVCPQCVLTVVAKKARISARDNCIECGACMQNCEYEAISVDAGVGCATAMIDGLLRYGDPDKGTCDCESTSPCCS